MSKNGSGKNRVQDALIDFISLLNKADRSFTDLLVSVDKSIAADLSNDPDLSEARRWLKESGTVDGDRAAEMRASALMYLEQAMEKDFADHSKERIREKLMPYVEKLSEFKESAHELIGNIDGKVSVDPVEGGAE